MLQLGQKIKRHLVHCYSSLFPFMNDGLPFCLMPSRRWFDHDGCLHYPKHTPKSPCGVAGRLFELACIREDNIEFEGRYQREEFVEMSTIRYYTVNEKLSSRYEYFVSLNRLIVFS